MSTIGTRIDVAYAINRLSQFNHEFKKVHYQAGKHALGYLRGFTGRELTYQPTGGLSGYADAAFSNARGFKSTTGHFFTLASEPITWTCQKQSVVAVSTTEAGYIAALEASRQAVWLAQFLYTIRIRKSKVGPLYADNEGPINLSKNPVFQNRTNHLKIKYHAIREYVETGEIEIGYVRISNISEKRKSHDLVCLPPGKKALGGKWVYKIKMNEAGETFRFKARWVIQGFRQRKGIDYNETYALVVESSTIRPSSLLPLFAAGR